MKKSNLFKMLLAGTLALSMTAFVACNPNDPVDPLEPVDPVGPVEAKLSAPSNFTIENNVYTFNGVDGASYYVIYFYNSASDADDDYIASTAQIKATSQNGIYSAQIYGVSAGIYNVRLFAFDSDDESSDASVLADCGIIAELSVPQIEYWYDAYANKLDLQLYNFFNYSQEDTPVVEVTVTDTETEEVFNGSFTVETIEKQYETWQTDRGNYPYVEFASLMQGHTYAISAKAVAQSDLAASSEGVVSFEEVTLGITNSSSEGFDKAWSTNVVGDSIACLDVTVKDEIVFSSENSTVNEIADGALMNFRYRQANADGRATGFKRDFGYGIIAVQDAVAAEGCAYSYTLSYAQGTNTGDGYLYLYTDGSVAFVLNAPASGVPVGASFTGGWLYLDDAQTTVAVNVSINYLVSLFAD